ncbi:hypothetical protein Tco_0940088 [Tanacetum coccineum]|uniref:Uncharacterized protein n=1 Tax=Tanacetum coccineum TaxID=301880 RepID=A0ABQ5DMR6_9ASTR
MSLAAVFQREAMEEEHWGEYYRRNAMELSERMRQRDVAIGHLQLTKNRLIIGRVAAYLREIQLGDMKKLDWYMTTVIESHHRLHRKRWFSQFSTSQIDKEFSSSLPYYPHLVCGGPFFGYLLWRLTSLPTRFGGLGLYSAKVVSSYAFVASRAQSWVLQDHILRDNDICGMDDDYVSALTYLRDTIPSFDFSGFTNKDTAPSKAQQTLESVLFIEIVKDIEVHFDMTMRQKACLDSFGEHAVYCKGLSGFKYRHDMVMDVIFNICRKHACVDLTGVSPLVGLSSHGFIASQAALKAASCKVTKHKKTYIKNQHVFISFAFDTFGFLAPEAVELLNRVQRVMHINVMTPRSTDVVFKRFGFAIQKGVAAQLVARLPSTTM